MYILDMTFSKGGPEIFKGGPALFMGARNDQGSPKTFKRVINYYNSVPERDPEKFKEVSWNVQAGSWNL